MNSAPLRSSLTNTVRSSSQVKQDADEFMSDDDGDDDNEASAMEIDGAEKPSPRKLVDGTWKMKTKHYFNQEGAKVSGGERNESILNDAKNNLLLLSSLTALVANTARR